MPRSHLCCCHSRFGALLLALGLLAPAWSACADTLHLSGSIGTYAVNADLTREGAKLDGWYFYRSQAREIRLAGSIDAQGAFRLEEHDAASGKTTAQFEGKMQNGRWRGTWRKLAGGAPLPLLLEENHQPAAALSGDFSCEARERDTKYGFTTRWQMQLKVRAGKVQSFHAGQTAHDDRSGDEHACDIGLADLAQQSAAAGILLRARDQEGGDGHDCTVRIVADAASVRVLFGDPVNPQDDCHQSGTTMYCSPRAGWSDLVIDRASRRCLPVK